MGYVRRVLGPLRTLSLPLCVERADTRVNGYVRNGLRERGLEQVVADVEGTVEASSVMKNCGEDC